MLIIDFLEPYRAFKLIVPMHSPCDVKVWGKREGAGVLARRQKSPQSGGRGEASTGTCPKASMGRQTDKTGRDSTKIH